MYCGRLQRVVPSLWFPVFLAYFVLLNLNLVIPGYILLLLYAAIVVVPSLHDPPIIGLKDAVLLCCVAVVGHFPFLVFARLEPMPLYAYVFSSATAIIEELFYRGFLLESIGLPIQALVFMYSHLSILDPVFLVDTALLAPHYYLFGLTAGLVAGKKGFEGSSVFHVTYNLVGLNYILQFNIQSVSLLAFSDTIVLIATWYFLYFNNRKTTSTI